MIKDLIFGELEYDYIWHGNCEFTFNYKKMDIALIVAGKQDGNFEDGQYEAYKALLNSWDNCRKI